MQNKKLPLPTTAKTNRVVATTRTNHMSHAASAENKGTMQTNVKKRDRVVPQCSHRRQV